VSAGHLAKGDSIYVCTDHGRSEQPDSLQCRSTVSKSATTDSLIFSSDGEISDGDIASS
jgi:hypothetical protein